MPERFKEYLESLPDSEAEPLIQWLGSWRVDGKLVVVDEDMTLVLFDSHPALALRLGFARKEHDAKRSTT